MFTTLIIVGVVLAIAGGVLGYCLIHAPEGHESEQGFEFGNEFAAKRPVRRAGKLARKPASISKDPYLTLQHGSAR